MSLEGLNQPLLVGVSGMAAAAVLPFLEQALIDGTIRFTTLKILNGVLYAINVYATQQPGRYDSMRQEQLEKGEKLAEVFSTRRGRTLLAPQGWAFAIWGPIFAGELVFCVSTALMKESSSKASLIKATSGGFMISQIFQTLWTASFRPRYEGSAIYMSSAMLSGIAYALSRAHKAFAVDTSYDGKTYWLYFLPISLHFGWTTAAALVNLNGNVAMKKDVSPAVLVAVGHASAVAATAAGVVVTMTRKAPVFGGVIVWALAACSAGMKERLDSTREKDMGMAGIRGARAQQWLCAAGAIISACVSLTTAISMSKQKSE